MEIEETCDDLQGERESQSDLPSTQEEDNINGSQPGKFSGSLHHCQSLQLSPTPIVSKEVIMIETPSLNISVQDRHKILQTTPKYVQESCKWAW